MGHRSGPNRRRWCSTRCRLAEIAWGQHGRIVLCPHCAQPFATTKPRQVYCSDPCNRRATFQRGYHAGRRRRFPHVNGRARLALFERDGWICQICDHPIDQTLRWPNPKSASLDHVDPNGPHEPANWQASHLTCNVAKGAWPSCAWAS